MKVTPKTLLLLGLMLGLASVVMWVVMVLIDNQLRESVLHDRPLVVEILGVLAGIMLIVAALAVVAGSIAWVIKVGVQSASDESK